MAMMSCYEEFDVGISTLIAYGAQNGVLSGFRGFQVP
jgi:hypothetical protein